MTEPAVTAERVSLTVAGDDVGVRYLTGGEGPPLVCCHGIGLDAASVSWRHALPVAAESRTVYALDFPGHGDSDAPRRQYTTAYYEDVLAAFLEELGLRGAGLVGISMGGAVALGHALHGGSPERLALVDSYGLGADAYWRRGAGLALANPMAGALLRGGLSTRAGVRANVAALADGRVPEDLVDDVHAAVSADSLRAMRSWQRHEFRDDGFRTDYGDRLAEVEVPTLLVHGAEDPLLPAEWSRRAVDHLERGELTVFPDCGHWPPRERPDRFERVLRAFLDEAV